MAKIPQGILGGISGKIGGIVGSSWKGINVIKTKPLSVANPKTAGQVAQRTKFSNTVAFAGVILATVIKPLWDRFASKMSGYNAFVETNINLFAAASPSPAADLVISKGKMSKTTILTGESSEAGNTVTLTWPNDAGEGFKLAADEAYIVIVNETDEFVEAFETAVLRSALTAEVEPSIAIDEGVTMNVYLAFKRSDGTIVSNTSYKTFVGGA